MFTFVEDLNKYSGNFDEELNSLKEIFLDSAESIVIDYLGYNPLQKDYASIISGADKPYVQLRAQPVTEIKTVKVDGTTLDPADFITEKEMLIHKDLEIAFTTGSNNVLITYTAGYADEDLPGVVKLTVLRIASLMLVETGGNIGATSKSMQDGSRTFSNTRDYSPYLKVLDTIRVERI